MLTDKQVAMLRWLKRQPNGSAPIGGNKQIGMVNTCKALERKGLAVRFHGGLLYGLTDKGRKVAHDL
jgi:hypothetical protein